jgi:surfeit locus 1 family protein
MLSTLREKRLLWPAVATLAGVALLIALGNWQMRRLAWKEGLIAAIAERTHAEPISVADAEHRGGDIEYLRVKARGKFLNDKELHFYALDERDGMGWHILTPLQLADGAVVFVNRGFVPDELKDAAKRKEGEPGGEVEIVGLVRKPEIAGAFTPANDAAKNVWYWRDLSAMAAAALGTSPSPDEWGEGRGEGQQRAAAPASAPHPSPLPADAGRGDTRVIPFVIDAELEPRNPGGWPRGGVTRLELPNRHLEYALTWYGLAAALIGVFAAFAATRWRQPGA